MQHVAVNWITHFPISGAVACLGKHGGAGVDTDHVTLRTYFVAEQREVETGATTDVKDTIARFQTHQFYRPAAPDSVNRAFKRKDVVELCAGPVSRHSGNSHTASMAYWAQCASLKFLCRSCHQEAAAN